MKTELEEVVSSTEKSIKESFELAFSKIYENGIVPNNFNHFDVKIVCKKITKYADFKGVPSRSGFYIILTNCPIEGNKCTLKKGSLTAVYRGQSSVVKKRLSSHLTNRIYNALFENRKKEYLKKKDKNAKFYEKHFGACMKFNPAKNGIDVTDEEYKDYSWIVIAHEMLDSSERIRELAEIAFDNKFGKPIASRE